MRSILQIKWGRCASCSKRYLIIGKFRHGSRLDGFTRNTDLTQHYRDCEARLAARIQLWHGTKLCHECDPFYAPFVSRKTVLYNFEKFGTCKVCSHPIKNRNGKPARRVWSALRIRNNFGPDNFFIPEPLGLEWFFGEWCPHHASMAPGLERYRAKIRDRHQARQANKKKGQLELLFNSHEEKTDAS